MLTKEQIIAIRDADVALADKGIVLKLCDDMLTLMDEVLKLRNELEVANRFHDVAVQQRDLARHGEDALFQANRQLHKDIDKARSNARSYEVMASIAAERCRNEPGRCWCTAHTGSTFDSSGSLKPLIDRHKPCPHIVIKPYGSGDFGKCDACGDDTFPITEKAAYPPDGVPPDHACKTLETPKTVANLMETIRAQAESIARMGNTIRGLLEHAPPLTMEEVARCIFEPVASTTMSASESALETVTAGDENATDLSFVPDDASGHAFRHEMRERIYGHEEAVNAWYFFKQGWRAAQPNVVGVLDFKNCSDCGFNIAECTCPIEERRARREAAGGEMGTKNGK